MSGRDTGRGAAVVTEIEAVGGTARFIQADLADLDSVRDLAAWTGDVDVLVNNAAVAVTGPTFEQDAAGFDGSFTTNVRAP